MNSEIMAEELFQQLRNNSKVSLAEMLNDFNRGEIGVLGYLVFDKDNVTSGELSEKLKVSTAYMKVYKTCKKEETACFFKFCPYCRQYTHI